MREPDVRDLLAQADREKAVARWADDMQNTIRLHRPIKLAEMKQRGPFGKKRTYLYELDDRMPSEGVDAIYRALHVVRDEATAKAAAIEARITTTPNGASS